MKMKQFLMALLLCGCAALTSCEKTPDEPTPTDGIDRSLAGSMLVSHWIMDATVTYDDGSWRIPEGDIIDCMMRSEKVSDTNQRVEYNVCWSGWGSWGNRYGRTKAVITIPTLPLLGEPYVEVMFYHVCNDVTAKLNDTEYTNVPTKIKGWVKRVSTESPEVYTSWVNKGGIEGPMYTCDIEMECIIDGKELKFHITRLD